MSVSLHGNSLEYFRELVESSVKRQHLIADELTIGYVVQLLTSFTRSETPPSNKALAFQLYAALETGGTERRKLLRQTGNTSLFMGGFFPNHLRRSLVDVDYYAQLGSYAYGYLSRCEEEALAGVFDELSDKFLYFCDVLGDVAENAKLSDKDLLTLCHRYVLTGSPRLKQKLDHLGVVLVDPKDKLLQ